MVVPLGGVRVVDLTRLLPGPAATWLLAALGAEVIKVESIDGGDPTRAVPPFVGDPPMGSLFRTLNRGKKSLALDLKTLDGQAALHHVVAHSHVVVEGFRPGTVARLGLDEDFLDSVDGLVFASLSGFGATGPDARRAGHDLSFVARAGILEVPPTVPRLPMADMGGAYALVAGICAGLVRAARTGLGSRVDVSLLDVAVTLGIPRFSQQGGPTDEFLDGSRPCYALYPAADGHLAVAALEPHFWQSLCQTLERTDLAPRAFEPLSHGGQEVYDALSSIFREHPRDHWARLFRERDVCVEPVLRPDEIFEDPHLRMRGSVSGSGPSSPLRFEPSPAELGPAPTLGQHSRAVLEDLGLPTDLLRRLI